MFYAPLHVLIGIRCVMKHVLQCCTIVSSMENHYEIFTFHCALIKIIMHNFHLKTFAICCKERRTTKSS